MFYLLGGFFLLNVCKFSSKERQCPIGFLVVRGECIDFDECKKHNGFCQNNVHCINTVGSYSCGCRDGYEIKEEVNWELFMRKAYCVDIDECGNRDTCSVKSTCENTDGSYFCQCQPGFEGDLCEDIDECSQTTTCDANAACLNTDGSFMCSCNVGYRGDGVTCKVGECDDRRCPPNQKCVSPTTNECHCNQGFIMNAELDFCEDVDECMFDHDCHQNSVCVDSDGTYACICNPGYIGDGRTCEEGTCTDDICPVNAECIMPSKPDCRCKDGYKLEFLKSNGTEICVDTDECSTLRDICHEKAVCMNLPGGYKCNCQEGYFGDGKTCFRGSCTNINCPLSDHKECVSPRSNDCKCTVGFAMTNSSVCIDVDECKTLPCDQFANCSNNPGGFSCSCSPGYVGDGMTCEEGTCTDDMCPVDQECVTSSTLDCRCKKKGFELKSEICVDTDECLSDICHEKAVCRNFPGGYECNCQEGYFGNGENCSPGNCTDIDCPLSNHKKCITLRRNDCNCIEGFEMSNSSVCVDIDECQKGLCDKNAMCANKSGNFSCTCNSGYEGDGLLCSDLKTVLVLYNAWKTPPLLVDAEGRSDSNFIFSFGEETDVQGSRSVTYRNRLFVYGGYIFQRQISEVKECELRRVGNLDFDHYDGACSNTNDRLIYLCFGGDNKRLCRSADDPFGNFTETAPSTFDHRSIKTAASPGKLYVMNISIIFLRRATRSRWYPSEPCQSRNLSDQSRPLADN